MCVRFKTNKKKPAQTACVNVCVNVCVCVCVCIYMCVCVLWGRRARGCRGRRVGGRGHEHGVVGGCTGRARNTRTQGRAWESASQFPLLCCELPITRALLLRACLAAIPAQARTHAHTWTQVLVSNSGVVWAGFRFLFLTHAHTRTHTCASANSAASTPSTETGCSRSASGAVPVAAAATAAVPVVAATAAPGPPLFRLVASTDAAPTPKAVRSAATAASYLRL